MRKWLCSFVKQSEESKMVNSSGLQNIKIELKNTPKVRVLKIEVLEGYEDFFTIHNVGILWIIKDYILLKIFFIK